MGIVDRIKALVSSAEVATAASKAERKPFEGKLPDGVVKFKTKGQDAKRLQKFLNWSMGTSMKASGIFGTKSTNLLKKWQKKHGLEEDGIFGDKCRSKAKWEIKKYAPEPTLYDKLMDACKAQAKWAKNAIYKWVANPNLANSKEYETCVTYVAVVLQRLGYLKSGKYIWIDERGRVFGTTSRMSVTYMKGTLRSNRDKFKPGDICIGGNGNIHAASGSHIFVLTGKWDSNGNPYIYDQASAERVRVGKSPAHTWNGSFRMIARIRLKG